MKWSLAGLLMLSGVQASLYDIVWPRAAEVTSNCTQYTIQTGDTCFSIGGAQNVTFSQLLAWNSNIDTICSNLGNLTGNSICISNPLGNFAIPTNLQNTTVATTAAPIPSPTPSGTNSYCGEYYYVNSGEDCSTITEKFSISLSDFLFLNSEVYTNCTNLLADEYYCVEPVGSISTYNGYGGTTTTTVPFNQTSATALPDVGDILANYTSSTSTIPIANNTRVDCYSYIVFDNLTDNQAADCWSLAIAYGISGEELVLWNPSLAESNATSSIAISVVTTTAATATATATANLYAYSCSLAANTSYCVELMSPVATSAAAATITPSPRAANEIANCTAWYQVEDWDTCEGILMLFYLDIAEFYDLNPSVGSDCTGMNLGTYYCISTDPGGEAPWTTLPDNYTMTATVTSSLPADTDTDTATGTATGTVTGTATGTGTATATGTTGDGITTPSPVQTGMVSNCDLFHEVASGDTCYDLAQTNSITLDQFYAWNPAVGTDCADLELNVYVCIGVLASSSTVTPTTTSSSTLTATTTTSTGGVVTPTPIQDGMVSNCNTFYDVQSGDGCWAIANEYGITLDNFYAWNPAVDECADLYPNYYVCVGISG